MRFNNGSRELPGAKEMRIALIGNLANVGYELTKFLRRKGIEADLFLYSPTSGDANPQLIDPEIESIQPQWIRYYDPPHQSGARLLYPLHKIWNYARFLLQNWQLTCKLSKYDLVHSFTGRLSSGPFLSFYFEHGFKPYVATATGSDLREVTLMRNRRGRRMRRHFQKAKLVFSGFDEINVSQFKQLRLSQVRAYPAPVDTDKWAPVPADSKKSRNELLLFHPSHLDWSHKGSDRSSMKGSDRFLKAFARYVKDGNNASLILLDRGVDAVKTRELLRELHIEDKCEFLPETDREGLIKYFNKADVVVDQFDVGSSGGTCREAMSCAKPVMIYINTEYSDLVYPDRPPVLNCNTEDEIYQQLLKASDKEYREQLGRQAREWILKYHHWEKAIDKLIFHYETIVGTEVTH